MAKISQLQYMPDGNPFEDRCERINAAGSGAAVVRAQKHFWSNMDGGNAHTNQTFFGAFTPDEAVQLKVRLDGLYRHRAGQEGNPLQHATGGDEPPPAQLPDNND